MAGWVSAEYLHGAPRHGRHSLKSIFVISDGDGDSDEAIFRTIPAMAGIEASQREFGRS